MANDGDTNAGFSTLELLVAFVILSLGLGIAVQTIAQSATNLKRSTGYAEETLTLRRLFAEELPGLVAQGQAVSASGPTWKIRLEPAWGTPDQRSTSALIEIAKGSGATSYNVVLPHPTNAASASGQP